MQYDYIFCGFGLSAMVVMDELIDAGMVRGKKILILEPQFAATGDKTWCFWEQGDSKWDGVLAKSWEKALFLNTARSINCLSEGMVYKMLDPQKLFAYIESKMEAHPDIEIRREKVGSVTQLNGAAKATTCDHTYTGTYIFNSIYDKAEPAMSNHPLLLQHFLGWYVKAEGAAFDADTAILMDFSVPQRASTRFMYVLPLSDEEFLIEFTLFSSELLPDQKYAQEIGAYLKKRGIENYEVKKTEKGVIPMTAFPFWKKNTANILFIGTAGGWTKSSSGYTFNSARAKAGELISFLNKGDVDFRKFRKGNRFYWYDRLLIDVLVRENSLGCRLFTGLFLKANPVSVLKFLNERSTISEEIRIIMACPKIPFLKAVLRTMFRRCKHIGGEKLSA